MRILSVLIFTAVMSIGGADAQEHATTEKEHSKVHATERTKAHEGPRPYDGERDALADVDQALAAAQLNGTKALIVMGANWCHDSRGLAGRFERAEFQTLIADNYELVYVSAGTETRQNDQNREVSKRFGVDKIEGTPTVFIVDGEGSVLNSESTGYWRRADSIPVDMSYAYFEFYSGK